MLMSGLLCLLFAATACRSSCTVVGKGEQGNGNNSSVSNNNGNEPREYKRVEIEKQTINTTVKPIEIKVTE